MSAMFNRQNDPQAIIYLKAARYCQNRIKFIKYTIISLSVTLCLCGIFNRYLTNFFEILQINIETAEKMKKFIDSYLGLSSGLLLLSQIFLNRYVSRMQIEKNNLMENYDTYVYNLMQNKAIMRPLNDLIVTRYARKVFRKDKKFMNHYFKTPEEATEDHSIFENIRKQFLYDYNLLLSVKTFFKIIWYGFIVVICLTAMTINIDFITTLLTIIIPSLSIILMIFNSEHSHSEQMRYMKNNVDIMNKMREEGFDRRNLNPTNLTAMLTLRTLQDSLFVNRSSEFAVPSWLIRHFEKKEARLTFGAQTSGKNLLINQDKAKAKSSPADDKTKKIMVEPAKSIAKKEEVKIIPKQPAKAYDKEEIKHSSKDKNVFQPEKSIAAKEETKPSIKKSETAKSNLSAIKPVIIKEEKKEEVKAKTLKSENSLTSFKKSEKIKVNEIPNKALIVKEEKKEEGLTSLPKKVSVFKPAASTNKIKETSDKSLVKETIKKK